MKENRIGRFFSGVCIFFTILLFAKFILEYLINPATLDNSRSNIALMFLICVISSFILEQHKRFERLPMLLVLILQYIIALAIVMLIIWFCNRFSEPSKNVYRDMFISFTIPYIIGAVWYYISLFYEVKKANSILEQVIKRENRENEDNNDFPVH